MTFQKNFEWQGKFIDEIKRILKSQAMHIVNIEIATPEEDMKKSTDYKIKITSGDVAVRLRRAYYSFRDLTIRAINGNSKTEIHKLREGYADWYLYGWTNDCYISEWMLLDINKMREHDAFSESRPIIMNNDNYTGFVTYSIPELEEMDAVVTKQINIPS